MKRLIIGLCIVIGFIAIGAACANQPTSVLPAPSTTSPVPDIKSNAPIVPTKPTDPQPDVVVNVDDLMANPDSYIGQIRVEGVVSSVSPGQRTIGIIDSREFAACGTTTCPSFILPIKWSGSMPRVEDTIQAVGEVQKLNEKFIFVAYAVDNIKQQTGSLK